MAMPQPARVTISGQGFDETAAVQFVDGDGRFWEVTEQFVSTTTLIVPQLTGLAPGTYSVRVTRPDKITVELPNIFTVVEGGEAQLQTNLVVPGNLSPGFPVKQTVWVEYSNTGDIAMPAPLLMVTVNSTGLLTDDELFAESLRGSRALPNSLGSSIQLIGVGSDSTPGTLQPGESGSIPVYYVGLSKDRGQGSLTFSLGSLTAADTTEKVAHLEYPDERVVYERPRSGELLIDVNKPVWPYYAKRSAESGTGVGPTTPLSETGSGGGGGGESILWPIWPNCYEEFLVQDWYAIRNDARPATINEDAWNTILYNSREKYGDFWAGYIAELADNANYLGTVGQKTHSVADLWSFEVAQAAAAVSPVQYLAGAVDISIPTPGIPLTFSRVYGQSMPSRFESSTLGLGWTHNWDIQAVRLDFGDVILQGPGGSDRFFTRRSDGTYIPSAGDYGQLILDSGSYRLTELDHTTWQFRADGKLDFVEDSNGNRISLEYAYGRLGSISHSNGRQILLDYSFDDFGEGAVITRVVDTMGPGSEDDRVTSFNYDFGQHGIYLLSVTAPGNRTTQYTYNPLSLARFKPVGPRGDDNPEEWVPDPRSHALTSVAYPDSTFDYFAYDNRGRLTETSQGHGAERVTFTYDDASPGRVRVTDATGRVTDLYFGLGGQLAQVRDGQGRIVGFEYDALSQLTELRGPGGERYRYEYGDSGNLTGIRDALNLETSFSYEADFSQLASFTDARGNGIQYQYDDHGNLTTIIYADGSQEAFTYDAIGNVLTSTNRRDQTIAYSYNAAGLLTSKDYDTTPGIDFTYTYDAAGNLTEATDSHGTTAMSYDPETDWLTRIEYPGGQFFTFAYDAVGRRTQRTDQDDNVVNYHYDVLGRLDTMTDGSSALIVDYDYDAGRSVEPQDAGQQRLHHLRL